MPSRKDIKKKHEDGDPPPTTPQISLEATATYVGGSSNPLTDNSSTPCVKRSKDKTQTKKVSKLPPRAVPAVQSSLRLVPCSQPAKVHQGIGLAAISSTKNDSEITVSRSFLATPSNSAYTALPHRYSSPIPHELRSPADRGTLPRRVTDLTPPQHRSTLNRLAIHQVAVQSQQERLAVLANRYRVLREQIEVIEESKWGVKRKEHRVNNLLSQAGAAADIEILSISRTATREPTPEILGGLEVDRVLTRKDIQRVGTIVSQNNHAARSPSQEKDLENENERAQRLALPIMTTMEERDKFDALQKEATSIEDEITALEREIHDVHGAGGGTEAEWARRLSDWGMDWGGSTGEPGSGTDQKNEFTLQLEGTQAYKIAMTKKPNKR